MGRFVARVYQCRVCGSIISTSEGVQRHGQGCSLKGIGNIPNVKNLEQMAIVDFPCPKIFLQKLQLPSQLSNNDVESARGRAKSNRARPQPQYKEWSDSDKDDEDEDEDTSDDQTQRESELENYSENDLDASKSKKSRAGNQIRFHDKPNNDNPYACPIKGCPSRLKSTEKLRLHFMMHLQNNPYACPIPGCSVQLHDAWIFKRHMERHTGKNLLSCEKCGYTYNRSDRLMDHKCLKQRQKKRRTTDPTRRTITMSEEDVVAHLKLHFARLRENGFLLKENLDAEINMDSNPRIDISAIIQTDPVFLQVCKENPDFRDLIFGNGGGKPKKRGNTLFKCKGCTFTTTSVKNLKRHYGFAHASRPWRCAKCGMTFQREGKLKRHMKYHEFTENKVYVKLLADGKYECTKCGFASKHEVCVKKHWLLKHKVSVPNHRKVLPKVGNQMGGVPRKKKLAASEDLGIKDESPEISISIANFISPMEVEDEKCEFRQVGGIVQESKNFAKSADVTTVKIEHDIEPISTMSTPPHEEEDPKLEIETTETFNDIVIKAENQAYLLAPPRGNEEGRAYPSESDFVTTADRKPEDSSKKKLVSYNPDNPHPCPLSSCKARLKSKSQLKCHFIMHLENNPYACPLPRCNSKLDSLSHFKRHMEWHMGKNILFCEKCGQEYSRIDRLRSHKCSKKHPRSDANKRNIRSLDDIIGCLKLHYNKLKERGLLLQEIPEEDEGKDFDFNYKININKIFKTDPVFLQACKEDPTFKKVISGDGSDRGRRRDSKINSMENVSSGKGKTGKQDGIQESTEVSVKTEIG